MAGRRDHAARFELEGGDAGPIGSTELTEHAARVCGYHLEYAVVVLEGLGADYVLVATL